MSKFLRMMFSWVLSFGVLIAIALWIPAEGETNHVAFLVGSGCSFTLTYLDVIDFTPVERKLVIDVTKEE